VAHAKKARTCFFSAGIYTQQTANNAVEHLVPRLTLVPGNSIMPLPINQFLFYFCQISIFLFCFCAWKKIKTNIGARIPIEIYPLVLFYEMHHGRVFLSFHIFFRRAEKAEQQLSPV
jgi:hypothetical protein